MSKDAPNNEESGKNKRKKSEQDLPTQEYRLIPVDIQETSEDADDDIDIKAIIETLWESRKTIYQFVGAGLVLGLLVVLFSSKEYASQSTLMPEYSTESQTGASSLLEQYGGLLGLSGSTYASSSNAIRVQLYPNIAQSLPFQLELLQVEVTSARYDTTVTLKDYLANFYSPGITEYVKLYTIGLPGLIIGSINSSSESSASNSSWLNSNIVSITKDELEIIENLAARISVNLDEETGIVSVRSVMPEPEIAAAIADKAIDLLTNYLVEYRTEKVKTDLRFVEVQLAKAEKRFEKAQFTLAEFSDSNQGELSARAQTEQQRLQSEYNLAFNIYNTLAQQYEEAQLKVQEETPIFKTLQPVHIPVEDESNNAVTLIFYLFLAGFLGLIWIYIQQFLKSKSLLDSV